MAGSSSSVKIAPLDPDYIKFLLDPDLGFSCYFVVGNAELAPVEKIGVVRKMLAAHSSVFRAQLQSRHWESKEPEKITDILPATFKNLLRFVYGFDTTATISFEDADDLLYAADRYIMNRLKDKLATRLMSLLDYTNICSLLTNPACATVLELNSEITKILQCETDKVLGSPQFLFCCTDTFIKILEQEVMNIPELEVWRAALRWAKNKAKKQDAKSLRQQLERPLKHIRVCSLPLEKFRTEVEPAGVLTNEEAGAVCLAVVTRKKPETLTTVCSNMQDRRATASGSNRDCVKSEELVVYVGGEGTTETSKEVSFSLQTHSLALELTHLEILMDKQRRFTMTVRIESTKTTATTVSYTGNHTGLKQSIPLSTEQRPVVLLAETKYNITISSDTEFNVTTDESAVERLTHFNAEFSPFSKIGWGGYHSNGYGKLRGFVCYKTLTPL